MEENESIFLSRRDLLQKGALVFLLGALPGIRLAPAAAATPESARMPKAGPRKTPEVSPIEDLMREHGVLRRTLLVYEEIINKFVEDYHEKLEEDHLFPRFEKAGQLVDLVTVLRRQHQAGRRLTAEILKLGEPGGLKTREARERVADRLRLFIRMYRPHAAREDTVLFPAFRSLVPAREYEALGEDFEGKEKALFGEEGFERMVAEVAALEKQLGIYDLDQFTPKI
jgi:hemerythrin-like domain-containing protein